MESERIELLVRLLTRHQDELFRFVLSLHPHEDDARDILQETSVALCRKIDDYDFEQPFLPWAFGFAYLEVLKQREKNQRGSRLLSPDLVRELARERQNHQPILELRLAALEHCLHKLPETDQEMIRQRYQGNVAIEEMMHEFGSSRRTLFRNLDRIRRSLFDCISKRVELE